MISRCTLPINVIFVASDEAIADCHYNGIRYCDYLGTRTNNSHKAIIVTRQ